MLSEWQSIDPPSVQRPPGLPRVQAVAGTPQRLAGCISFLDANVPHQEAFK